MLVLLIVLLLVYGITFACVVCSFVVCLCLVLLLFCDGCRLLCCFVIDWFLLYVAVWLIVLICIILV